MKNKAKCKLCDSIIESYHPTDYVECKCGQCCVYGGEAMYCGAVDFVNFVRVDEDGNEFPVKVKEEIDSGIQGYTNQISRKDQINLLEEFIKQLEKMPQEELTRPVNYYDMSVYLGVIVSIFKTL